MASADRTAWKIASSSETGRVRSHNEDCCATFENPTGARLFVVADGMGGHRGGATASQMAVQALEQAFGGAESVSGAWLAEAIRSANQAVHERAARDAALQGMGTTLVAVAIAPGGAAWVGHVGDSRAYRLREGFLERLTEDHSVVAEMMRRGLVTAEEAENHPRRNEILRSVGVAEEVDAEVSELDLEVGDRLLLCSDGLCGVVPDAAIERLLADHPPGDAVERAVAAANELGGPDNITAVVIEVPPPPAAERASGSVFALLLLVALVAALLQFAFELGS